MPIGFYAASNEMIKHKTDFVYLASSAEVMALFLRRAVNRDSQGEASAKQASVSVTISLSLANRSVVKINNLILRTYGPLAAVPPRSRLASARQRPSH